MKVVDAAVSGFWSIISCCDQNDEQAGYDSEQGDATDNESKRGRGNHGCEGEKREGFHMIGSCAKNTGQTQKLQRVSNDFIAIRSMRLSRPIWTCPAQARSERRARIRAVVARWATTPGATLTSSVSECSSHQTIVAGVGRRCQLKYGAQQIVDVDIFHCR